MGSYKILKQIPNFRKKNFFLKIAFFFFFRKKFPIFNKKLYIFPVAALKKTTTKQEKELKELQKQCLQLGLQLGTDENREIDPAAEEALLDDNQRVPVIVETQEKPDLNDEEKEKRREEIRENIKKEMEKLALILILDLKNEKS